VPLSVACTGVVLWCSCFCQTPDGLCPDGGWWACGPCLGVWQNGCTP
jgi:hypothetical protein